MNFKVLNNVSMPFNREYFFDWDSYFIGKAGKDDAWFKRMSKYDFGLEDEAAISFNVYSCLHDSIFFYHSSNKIIKKLNVKTFDVTSLTEKMLPKYYWGNICCFHNLETKKYEVHDIKGNLFFDFKYNFPIVTQFIESGILIYQNNLKELNWISCIEPENGNIKWKVEFSFHIVRLEIYNRIIIVECQLFDNSKQEKDLEFVENNRHSCTIAINSDNGHEIWRKPFSYSKINYEHGVILTGGGVNLENGSRLVVIDIVSGQVINEVLATIEKKYGYIPHFVDSVGIFYTSYDNSFGKIDKNNGQVLWEFNLVGEDGKERTLSDWILLGNGELLMQFAPIQSRNSKICTFNPNENMEYSNVQ